MSLAWGTLSLILLVLPGFAGLFGFYSHSRLSGQLRDVTPKSQAGEIAMVVFLAFLVHAFLFLIPWGGLLTHPFERVGNLLDFVAKECLVGNQEKCVPSTTAKEYSSGIAWGIAYIVFTSLIGFVLGSLFIKGIEEHWLGLKIKRFHSWSFDLITGPEKPAIQVNVLTSIKAQGKEVEYRGTLDQMTLDSEQKITAVLLKDTTTHFAQNKRADDGQDWIKPEDTALVARDRVLIPGSQIVSISYDPIDIDSVGVQSLNEALKSLPEAAG